MAIALTLLVLPLVDIPQELKDGEGLDDALGDHWTEPFTTQLLTSALSSRGATALYDGVLVISSLSLVGISWWGRRRPELLIKSQHEEVSRWTGEPCRCPPRSSSRSTSCSC